MGCLVLTSTQWTAVQAFGNLPVVKRIYNRVGLGVPAGTDATGAPSDTPTHFIFDDPRLGSNWRVRVVAGPSLAFQEWDAPYGGTQVREITFAQMQAEFGSS